MLYHFIWIQPQTEMVNGTKTQSAFRAFKYLLNQANIHSYY